MIYVRVNLDAGFKNCCMKSGRFDGIVRDRYTR
jgi:hypothetical protein